MSNDVIFRPFTVPLGGDDHFASVAETQHLDDLRLEIPSDSEASATLPLLEEDTFRDEGRFAAEESSLNSALMTSKTPDIGSSALDDAKHDTQPSDDESGIAPRLLLSFSRGAPLSSHDESLLKPVPSQPQVDSSELAKVLSAPVMNYAGHQGMRRLSSDNVLPNKRFTSLSANDDLTEPDPSSCWDDAESDDGIGPPLPQLADDLKEVGKELQEPNQISSNEYLVKQQPSHPSENSSMEYDDVDSMRRRGTPTSTGTPRSSGTPGSRPPVPQMRRKMAFSMGSPSDVSERMRLLSSEHIPNVFESTDSTIRRRSSRPSSKSGIHPAIHLMSPSSRHTSYNPFSSNESPAQSYSDLSTVYPVDDGSLTGTDVESVHAVPDYEDLKMEPPRLPMEQPNLKKAEQKSHHNSGKSDGDDDALPEEQKTSAAQRRSGLMARALSSEMFDNGFFPKRVPAFSRSNSVTSSDSRNPPTNSNDQRPVQRRTFFRGRLLGRKARQNTSESVKTETTSASGDIREIARAYASDDFTARDSEAELEAIQMVKSKGSSNDRPARTSTSSSLGSAPDDTESSHYGNANLVPLDSLASDRLSSDTSSKDMTSVILLDQVVKQAAVGKCKLTDVLDAMYALTTRIDGALMASLFKYLSSPARVEGCMTLLRRGTSPSNSSLIKEGHFDDIRVAANPYHYVIVNSIVHGPSTLRKNIVSNPKARAELFSFFEEDVPVSRFSSSEWELRVSDMARVLTSLLHESPLEFTEYVAARKRFITTLLQNHISVAAVAEFVVQLCSANPLTETDASNDIRYGDPNATGIMLLAKENVTGQLVEIFESCADEVAFGGLPAARRRVRAESCLYCIRELSQRALVTPRYDKTNCSYSGRYIRQLNTALSRLSAFDDPTKLAKVLELSLGSLFGTPGDRGVSFVATCDVITQLLDMVNNGSRSTLSSTRMLMKRQETANLEQILLDRIEILKKLVTLKEGERGSLQQLRLTITDAFRGLFASKNAKTLNKLASEGIPQVLFNLLRTMEWANMLHARIAECIEIAFENVTGQNGTTSVQQAWMKAMDRGETLWNALLPSRQPAPGTSPGLGAASEASALGSSTAGNSTAKKAERRARRKYRGRGEEQTRDHGYYGAYTRIGIQLCEFVDQPGGLDAMRTLMAGMDPLEELLLARKEVLNTAAKHEHEPFAGPPPEKTTASLLASSISLAAVPFDDIDSV